MKYDDASWHSGAKNFPTDLLPDSAATHTGLYVAWAMLAGLGSHEFYDDFGDEVQKLRTRAITPSQVYKVMDGKFTNHDLSAEGNLFTGSYFDFQKGQFHNDYEQALCRRLPSMYHVADSWDSYDKLKPVLDNRLSVRRSSRN